MKKVTSILSVFIITFVLLAVTAVAAPQFDVSIDPEYTVMLIDADSGRVLYEQNADKQIRPASTTKILTTLITLENSSLEDTVTIGPEGDWSDRPKGYSVLDTREGEIISMKDLLYGMMLVSGDDAADSIAVHVAGSMDGFVAKMNDRAKELGMDSSHFENAGGVDKDGHHVTARDMSKLALAAMSNPQFMDIVRLWSYDMPETNKNPARTVENTNLLLDSESEFYYQYADGIKTGSTPKAGDCLVSSASKDGMSLICLFFGQKYTDDRWSVSKQLFEWGFDNFQTIDAAALITAAGPVEAQAEGYASGDRGGLLQFRKPEVESLYLTLEKSAAQALLDGTDIIQPVPAFDKPIKAPVKEGDSFGTVSYIIKSTGETIYTDDLIAERDILEQTVSEETPAATSTPMPTDVPAGNEESNEPSAALIIALIAGVLVFITAALVIINRNRQSKKRRSERYGYRRK